MAWYIHSSVHPCYCGISLWWVGREREVLIKILFLLCNMLYLGLDLTTLFYKLWNVILIRFLEFSSGHRNSIREIFLQRQWWALHRRMDINSYIKTSYIHYWNLLYIDSKIIVAYWVIIWSTIFYWDEIELLKSLAVW